MIIKCNTCILKFNKDGLKKCPFCAKQPKTYKFPLNENYQNNFLWTVQCKCGAESPRDSKSEQGAKRIWNRRRLAILETNKSND